MNVFHHVEVVLVDLHKSCKFWMNGVAWQGFSPLNERFRIAHYIIITRGSRLDFGSGFPEEDEDRKLFVCSAISWRTAHLELLPSISNTCSRDFKSQGAEQTHTDGWFWIRWHVTIVLYDFMSHVAKWDLKSTRFQVVNDQRRPPCMICSHTQKDVRFGVGQGFQEKHIAFFRTHCTISDRTAE